MDQAQTSKSMTGRDVKPALMGCTAQQQILAEDMFHIFHVSSNRWVYLCTQEHLWWFFHSCVFMLIHLSLRKPDTRYSSTMVRVLRLLLRYKLLTLTKNNECLLMSAELVAWELYYIIGFAVCSIQSEQSDPLCKYPDKKHYIFLLWVAWTGNSYIKNLLPISFIVAGKSHIRFLHSFLLYLWTLEMLLHLKADNTHTIS